MAERATTAIIIAPLRALCNEITSDMQNSFEADVEINQFSDILEDDFSLTFVSETKRILICTPEKLNYIIHHQIGFLSQLDLLIFDESHMFDDKHRGAPYEFLISELQQSLLPEQQLVLLSAVLSNAEEIRRWLFNGDGVLATDPQIKTTPKSVGFASASKSIHYYSDNSATEDFFVPKSIEVVTLDKLPKERKPRYFPLLSDSKDVAIYYAAKLCHNGGVAIYVSMAKSVRKTIERIIDLHNRSYDFTSIQTVSDPEELNKLRNLISAYYGGNHIYTHASSLGVFPHYSDLPNGIRLAIESAFRKKQITYVVCTSTLAQGVNIPIKYLLMTSFKVSSKNMQVRNFQNLMGRTARSGMYTEGSIIVTDTSVFDRKDTYEQGGRYRWNDHIKMFKANASEPCGSSILLLVRDFPIGFNYSISGSEIAKHIISNYHSVDCLDSLCNELLESMPSGASPLDKNDVIECISALRSVVHAIENHLCYIFSQNPTGDKETIALKICQHTLAYSMATPEEQSLLEQIFQVINEKISTLSTQQVAHYAKTMIGINVSQQIEQWIEQYHLTKEECSEEQLLQIILMLYKSVSLFNVASPIESVCPSWLSGCSLNEIADQSKLPIDQIEKICSKHISYNLSYLVGNIIDVLEIEAGDLFDPIPKLALIQRKLKYGVPNETSVSICEKIFNDRLLAYQLSIIIGHDAIDANSIVGAIKANQKQVLDFLSIYPSYYSDRVRWLCSK